MGLFDNTDPNGGLMGMYANPQMAGLLGLGQGLLASSGASRLPVTMGQALGNGVQGAEQGMGNAMQMQQNMFRMRAMQGLMGMGGGAPSGAQPQGQTSSYSSMFGPNSTAPASMPPMGGLGGAADGLSASGAPAPASAGIYGKSPQQLFQQGMLMNMAGIQGGGDLMRIAVEHDPTIAGMMPTDITKMGIQGGMTPEQIQQANAAGVAKANYIAPVNARPNSILRNPLTMQPMAFNPNLPAGTTPMFDASGNVVGASMIPGVTNALQQEAAAKTAGEGSQLPFTTGKDQYGNPLPVTNRTQAATGDMPAPLRNNNPGAMMPGGKLAQYPDMQTGLTAMDNNLASYGKQGVNTLSGVITKWAPPNENNTQAYIQDVSQRLGISPTQQIDLSNPAVRHAISTGIMLHENGPAAVFGGGAPQQGAQQSNGKIYAEAPMGVQKATETAQNAPSKQMTDSYNNLSTADASYQQSRGALTDMLALAHQMGPLDSMVSKLPAEYHNMNTPVTEYDKAHATFVSNQYNALSAGTDASKGTVNDMVPGSDKPQDAKIAGLNNQLNNLDYRHLETQLMTPSFNAGDKNGYTTLNAAFHNTIKPEMMPLINTLTGIQTKPELAAAISRVTKQYPQYKKAIDFLGTNGLFNGVQ